MSKHFQLLEFLRKAPPDLLQVYFSRSDIVPSFSWGTRRVDTERLAFALQGEGREVADRVTIHFRTIWNLSGRGFTEGVLNEAQFWSDSAAYDAIKGLKSHLAKAFWTTLERPQYVKKAKILSDVDRLPDGAWVKRSGLPARPGPVEDDTVAAFETALVEHFMRTEHRGANCKIDCLRRGDEESFFVYAEDHPDTELVWQGGQLEPQVLNPSFRFIFRHNDQRRTLDIHVSDDRRKVPALQQIFAKAVLGEVIEAEVPANNLIYDFDRFLQPGFAFEYSPELGIIDVRVVKMRFVLRGEPWRRFFVEANNAKIRDALTSFVEDLSSKLPRGRLELDQVHIKVKFEKREHDSRSPIRDCVITSPNILRLKKDDLGERIETMLLQSGIELHASEDDP